MALVAGSLFLAGATPAYRCTYPWGYAYDACDVQSVAGPIEVQATWSGSTPPGTFVHLYACTGPDNQILQGTVTSACTLIASSTGPNGSLSHWMWIPDYTSILLVTNGTSFLQLTLDIPVDGGFFFIVGGVALAGGGSLWILMRRKSVTELGREFG